MSPPPLTIQTNLIPVNPNPISVSPSNPTPLPVFIPPESTASLSAILTSYEKNGESDVKLLMAILKSKSSEDDRAAAMANLYTERLKAQRRYGGSSPSYSPLSPPNSSSFGQNPIPRIDPRAVPPSNLPPLPIIRSGPSQLPPLPSLSRMQSNNLPPLPAMHNRASYPLGRGASSFDRPSGPPVHDGGGSRKRLSNPDVDRQNNFNRHGATESDFSQNHYRESSRQEYSMPGGSHRSMEPPGKRSRLDSVGKPSLPSLYSPSNPSPHSLHRSSNPELLRPRPHSAKAISNPNELTGGRNKSYSPPPPNRTYSPPPPLTPMSSHVAGTGLNRLLIARNEGNGNGNGNYTKPNEWSR